MLATALAAYPVEVAGFASSVVFWGLFKVNNTGLIRVFPQVLTRNPGSILFHADGFDTRLVPFFAFAASPIRVSIFKHSQVGSLM
jgi:hypothetical protein